jgi:glutathione synthase/RimK-type ligase-like ATP-grasp enzyme
MLEDKKINFDDFIKAVSDSIGFEFNQYRENIKYPHFIFYVQKYLEKEYGKELLSE